MVITTLWVYMWHCPLLKTSWIFNIFLNNWTKIYFLSFLLIFTHMTLLTFLRALENKIQRSEIQFPMEDLYFSLSHTNDIFLYLTTRLKINYHSHFILYIWFFIVKFIFLQFQSLVVCCPFSQWCAVLTAFYSHTFLFQQLPLS